MQLQDFLDRFSQEFTEVEPGRITAETVFRDLDEWSSMQALIIIAMIDEEFGVTLSAEDMREAKTVGDIFTKVSSRQN